MDVDGMFARRLAHGSERRIALFIRDRGEQAIALALHDVGHFRCEEVIGAGAGLLRSISFSAVARLACGSTPERI